MADKAASEEQEKSCISLKRSDGRGHDLTSASLHPGTVRNFKLTGSLHTTEDDHSRINVKRSDGLSHDTIRAMKGLTDPTGITFRLQSQQRPSFIQRLLPTQEESTAAPSNAYPYAPSSVRIVHMADTHDFLNEKMAHSFKRFLPAGDILVHSGDFTNNGTDEEYAQFDKWLASVSNIYLYRVICIGNRDLRVYGNDWDTIRTKLPNATHVLCHNEANILGLRFYGSPWHWGYKVNNMLRLGAPVVNRYADIPDGVDVLVTHSAAYGRLDAATVLPPTVSSTNIFTTAAAASTKTLQQNATSAGLVEHWGSHELADALKASRPLLHLHGHVHDARGFMPAFSRSPMSVNSVMVDKTKSVMFAGPHVIRGTRLGGIGNGSSPPGRQLWEFSLDDLL